MQITYYGHSCFAVKVGGKTLLFDPFISKNPLAAHIDIQSIEADYILISHAHFDHTADAVFLATKTQATVIAIAECAKWFKKNGITKTHELNIGGSYSFDFGSVKMVNAVHTSTFPDGFPGGSPAGFFISSDEGNFYYAGDTALHYDMKILGKYYKMDFAFLPIGDNYTMGVDDALIASKFIKCDKIIGMHYDTFDTIKLNAAEATRKFKDQEKKLLLLKIGETIEI